MENPHFNTCLIIPAYTLQSALSSIFKKYDRHFYARAIPFYTQACRLRRGGPGRPDAYNDCCQLIKMRLAVHCYIFLEVPDQL